MKRWRTVWKSVTIRFAFAMWCLTSPPPRMIIPVFLARTAWVLILRMSATECTSNNMTDSQRPVSQFPLAWMDRWTYPPRCLGWGPGSCTSGSRACRRGSHRSERDWTLECCSDTKHKGTFKKWSHQNTKLSGHFFIICYLIRVFLVHSQRKRKSGLTLKIRTHLVCPVVDGLWIIYLFAKTMDHFGRGPTGSLHWKVLSRRLGWWVKPSFTPGDDDNTKQKILNRSYPPLCSAPTASGPGWGSASPQTYSSCHWGPAGSQSCIQQRAEDSDETVKLLILLNK